MTHIKKVSETGQDVSSLTQQWPHYGEDEIEAVARVLRSGRANSWFGTECRDFEREFADYCGTTYAIALANGTVALELALRALGIGHGDEVVVTPRSFVASASCASLCGARPVFADVDADSQGITAESIRAVLTPRTRAIVVVHLAGRPCEMTPIMALAEAHDLKVIEDCAQAHGARYRGRVVGSIGHVGTFSFCQDKIMSTGGEGGMLVTGIHEVWERAWAYKDHGKSPAALQPPAQSWKYRWLHDTIGTNMRMTEMQAAIGRVQLGKLDCWLARRAEHARVFDGAFENLSALRLMPPPPHVRHAYYKYYAFIRPERLKSGWDRDRILQAAQSRGLPCFSGSCGEIYRERCFADTAFAPSQPLPVARTLGETSLMTLVHPTLAIDEVRRTAAGMAAVIQSATA
ncbi:MAG: GDP-perosamine synthase [Gammaproteobacteria bacterium]|nr:GDP-perosamine synthase [Gammaproteobacteria bacterium]